METTKVTLRALFADGTSTTFTKTFDNGTPVFVEVEESQIESCFKAGARFKKPLETFQETTYQLLRHMERFVGAAQQSILDVDERFHNKDFTRFEYERQRQALIAECEKFHDQADDAYLLICDLLDDENAFKAYFDGILFVDLAHVVEMYMVDLDGKVESILNPPTIETEIQKRKEKIEFLEEEIESLEIEIKKLEESTISEA